MKDYPKLLAYHPSVEHVDDQGQRWEIELNLPDWVNDQTAQTALQDILKTTTLSQLHKHPNVRSVRPK